jgi:hypothetical protein
MHLVNWPGRSGARLARLAHLPAGEPGGGREHEAGAGHVEHHGR